MRKKITTKSTLPTLSLSECIYSFNREIDYLLKQIGKIEKQYKPNEDLSELHQSTALQYIGQMVAYKKVIQVLQEDLDISK